MFEEMTNATVLSKKNLPLGWIHGYVRLRNFSDSQLIVLRDGSNRFKALLKKALNLFEHIRGRWKFSLADIKKNILQE